MAIYQTIKKEDLNKVLNAITLAQAKRKVFYNIAVYPHKKDINKLRVRVG